MSKIKVIKPGLATHVQDNGRYGYYHLGIPPGGAIDQFSYKAGNILLGNDEDLAALEVALLGPELGFSDTTYLTITGADMTPIVNGERKQAYSVLKLEAGDVLSFDYMKNGAKSYICVAGGIDVPIVMGSRSTYLLGGIGGYKGRKLEAGDELPVGSFDVAPVVGKSIDDRYRVKLEQIETLRVVMGLHDYKLSDESLITIFEDIFTVSSEADRTGFRFKNGRKITYRDLPQPFGAGSDPSNIPDACYPVGSMQAPGGNEPIVLQRDAVSGGGFAMYCTVISCDLDKMGQLPPNHKVKFKQISMDEAMEARAEYRERLESLRASL